MKTKRKILAIALIITACLLYWTIEPYSLNPFSEKPKSKSKISQSFQCSHLVDFNTKADSIINAAIDKNEFLGISTGLYSEKCGQWLSTAGFLNKKNQSKPSKNSQFRIASISKTMTAVAILQLFEKGMIDLDEPIQKYVPEFPIKQKGPITIRQILNHTSGIRYYKNLESIRFKHFETCVHALDKFKNSELEHKPGSNFLYSSFGYTLLGAIIENVTGKSFQNYMKENIWEPANMKNTSVENIKLENSNLDLYIKWSNSFLRFPQNDLSFSYSGGGILSTAEDLLNFGQAILEFKLLDKETTSLMKHYPKEPLTDKAYTYGWFNYEVPKFGQIIEHNGKQIGCSSFFRIYWEERKVAVVLANNMNSREEVRNLAIELSYLSLEMNG